MAKDLDEIRVAVLLPALNEAAVVPRVIAAFRATLPQAEIYVCDNGSTDGTDRVAAQAGAEVLHEPRRGKGNAVLRMFAEIDADVYLMCDADGTYDASAAPDMVRLLVEENLDMVVGARVDESAGAYRRGHRLGNKLFSSALGYLFGSEFTDILSGYRAFSHRFVKSFALMSRGFEVEVMLAIHALEMAVPAQELPTRYGEREQGDPSKLRTVRDGIRILLTILLLFKESKPFQVFGVCALALLSATLGMGIPVVVEFLETGLVPRFPSAILASTLGVLAAISLTVGLTLDTVSRGRREQKRLAYLAQPSLHHTRRPMAHAGSHSGGSSAR